MNNTKNILISKSDAECILNNLSKSKLQISNLEYYQLAFIHESYYQSIQNDIINNNLGNIQNYDNLYIPKESNERLEFLGDSVLKSIMGKYLYMRFPNEREGFLTRMKIKIEKTSTLHMFAKRLNFKKFLMLSPQIESSTVINYNRGRNTPSFYEDSFEAFIGAIILDFGDDGFKIAENFITHVIEEFVDFSDLIYTNDNFKDSLQRLFQNKKIPLPIYKTLTTSDKNFTKILVIDSSYCGEFKLDLEKIKKLSIDILNSYKTYNEEYDDLFKLLETHLIIGVGKDKKVVNAEQKCAKNCLNNLNTSLNY